MTSIALHRPEPARLVPVVSVTRSPRATLGEQIVILFFFMLGTVRYLTESVSLLPRIAQFFDFIFIPLCVVATLTLLIIRTRVRVRGMVLFFFCFAATAAWAVSFALNRQDVYAPAALLFLAGHLAPIAFAFVLMNWRITQRFPERLVGAYAAFAVLQIVVGLTQIPLYLRQLREGTESDALSGTYGANSDQLAVVLAVVSLVLLERQLARSARRGEWLLFLIVTAAMYFASFKTLWIVFPVVAACLMVASADRRVVSRIFFTGLIIAGGTLCILYLAPAWSIAFQRILDPTLVGRQGKFKAFRQIPSALYERPWGFAFGVGPGAYSSRGFRTFTSLTDEIAEAIAQQQGGDPSFVTAGLVDAKYLPPIAAKYVAPLMPTWGKGYGDFGSGKLSEPFSSYPSIIVEIGVLGAWSIFGAYLYAGWRLLKCYRRARRNRSRYLRTICFAALGGLLILAAISVFDNMLEVNRITVPIWILIGAALRHATDYGVRPA